MAKVFISHRGADTQEAEKLAQRLRDECGCEVRLDVWELQIGDSIVAWMEGALAGARFVVVCYSSHGVDAPWMSREWQSALANKLNGAGIDILPVRLTGREGPFLFADMLAADWMRDPDAAVKALCRAIAARSPGAAGAGH
jgi:hypothetical protein